MKEYIISNRPKIIFQIKWTSIIFTLIWTGYVLVQYNKGLSKDPIISVVGFIVATVLLPLFVEFMLAMQDFIAFNRYNNILNSEPFNQLARLGFTKAYTDKKSNWTTSMPTLVGHIDNYPVRIEVENGIVRIITDINLDMVDKENMLELKHLFGDKNVEYDWLGLALVYKPAKRKDLTVQSLESDLRLFIKFFITKKLDHWNINNNA
jgi:hypothetical protein